MVKLGCPPRCALRTFIRRWVSPIGRKFPSPAIRLRHRIQNKTGSYGQCAEKHQRGRENRGRETRDKTGRNELADDGDAQHQARGEKCKRDQGEELQGAIVFEKGSTMATTLRPSPRVSSFDTDPAGLSR